ncbi:MAG: hypothetical protein IH591_10840 [Bacteroidales bacterium]|nr:hypothetical protein [Bacteroidales bacterium]
MEIGSFLGLDLINSGEYYDEPLIIARLNSARAGIYHACRIYGCTSIHVPYYLCPTVEKFLIQNGIKVNSYFINNKFEPEGLEQRQGHAVLLVNYFGIISGDRMEELAIRFRNVVIDNSAAFFCNPVENCLNVYSPRKFFGVPDGCYVIGKDATDYVSEYKVDYSSDTSCFLLKRVEYGLDQTYKERMKNEERIDRSGILQMSSLTRMFLRSIDYQRAGKIRQENFLYAHGLFRNINLIDPTVSNDLASIPMVYPLVIEDFDLVTALRERKIYTGRLWSHILQELNDEHVETWLSSFLIPIPIDQRYSEEDINFVFKIITDLRCR